MDAIRFRKLLSEIQITDEKQELRIFGLSKEDFADLITVAGIALGEIKNDARLNPEWLELGPERDVTFLFHTESIKNPDLNGQAPPLRS